MKKKYYIPLLFTGSLVIFSFLPLFNYSIDQWRVLHRDYGNAYKGISINKNFLKLSYILDNKEKYDTLLMGSSRNASLDDSLISKHAYNMYYGFGVAGAHLHNLKVLLENKVKIKNIWLGLNDFEIWKDPKDHEVDWSRKTYKNDFLDKLDFYSFYLFKKIDHRDIKVLRGEYYLQKSNRIFQKDLSSYFIMMKSREKKISDNAHSWIKKMISTGSALLGYKDKEYRIDQTIEEIKEMKNLCDSNNIELTIFMYPSFYKTYLQYNQYKIEEFKRKLSSFVDFHDFYNLNQISLNELKWTDSSHFTLSIGNYIIENIQKNKFLVTKENIDSRITKTKKSIKNILNKPLLIQYIDKINTNIDLKSLKSIFDLKNNKYKYYKNDQFKLDQDEGFIKLTTKTNDPILILNKTKSKSENVILSYKFESDKNTVFQLFYKKTNESEYNEGNSISIRIRKGSNKFNLLIPSKYLNNALRIDLVNHIGTYKIKDFSIYSLK